MSSAQESPWHLDRKVPLAIIFALILQTVALASWAARLEARVAAMESAMLGPPTYGDRITRLESGREDQTRRLDRIEAKIDRLLEERREQK